MKKEEKQPYIGAPVTLISSLDVRYEGILFTIDPNESTVALQNVKCLGTEDRQKGDKAIPKSDTVYEFIIFRGENIKTICLSEAPKKEKHPINDPSILEVGPTEKSSKSSARMEAPHMQHHHQSNQNHHRGRPYHNQQHNQHHDQRWQNNQPRNYHYQQRNRYGPPNRRYYNNNRYNDRRRGPPQQYRRNNNYRYYNNRRPKNNNSQFAPGNAQFLTRSNGRDNNPENPVESIKDDFDFATANARFTKNDPEGEKEEAVEVPEAKPEAPVEGTEEKKTTEESEENANEKPKGDEKGEEKKEATEENKSDPAKASPHKFEYTYNAEKSFFDDLDSSTDPRNNRNARQRREVDTQTFGSIAANYAPRTYRNRYRGRRRYNNRRY